jgi:hypothetical protein
VNKVDVHRAWARPEGQWSPWVKPILFAALADPLKPRPLDPPPGWLTAGVIEPLTVVAPAGAPYRGSANTLADTVVVVDLPGAEGVLLGIALARHGFAPVPLYNGLWDEAAVVDMGPIMEALVDGADTVREVPGGAPPAFLLDADRLGRGRPVRGGDFDNRWFSAPTDFPSAGALWGAGLRRLVLIQRGDPWPAPDLAPTLLSFQQRGLRPFLARVDTGGVLAPLGSVRPPWPTRLGHALGRLFFKRRADGAFGEQVPRPSAA